MKRTIALLLIACLLAGTLQAFSEKTSYRNNFTLTGDSISEEERLFREWAATLVEHYRNEYAKLEPGKMEYRLESVPVMKIERDAWMQFKTEVVYEDREAALFYPYYWVAEQKKLFDSSTYAEMVNRFGVMTRAVPYRHQEMLDDPAKRQELFNWLLAEMLQQKQDNEPDLLTGTAYANHNRKGYYSYDPTTGTAVYDETLDFVQQQAEADVWADAAKVAADSLNVAVKAYLTYHNVRAKGTDIAATAMKEMGGKPDIKGIAMDLAKEMLFTVLDSLDEGLEQLIEDLRSNAKKDLTNRLRSSLKIRMANAWINRNENVAGYLRATYIDHPVGRIAFETANTETSDMNYDPSREFKEAVIRLIQAIDAETLQAGDLADETLRKESAERIVDNMLTEVFKKEEEIFDTGTVVYHMVTGMIIEMADGTTEALFKFLDKTAREYLAKSGDAKKIAGPMIDFLIQDICGEIGRRLTISMKEVFKEYDPVQLNAASNSDDVLMEVSEYWEKIKEKFIENMSDFGDYAGRKVISLALREIGGAISVRGQDGSSVDEYQNALETIIGNGAGNNGNELLQIVFPIVFTSAFSVWGAFSDTVLSRADYLTEVERKDLKRELTAVQKAMEKLNGQAFAEDNLWDAGAASASLLMMLLQLNSRYPNENVLQCFFSELATAAEYVLYSQIQGADLSDSRFIPYRESQASLTALENLLKNESFWNTVVGGLFGETDTKTMLIQRWKADIYNDAGDGSSILGKEELWEENRKKISQRLDGNVGLMDGIKAFTEIFKDLWSSSKELGGSFWTLVNSAFDSATGEDQISMIAQRINAIKEISDMLALNLRACTIGGIRTNHFNNRDIVGLRQMDRDADDNQSTQPNNAKRYETIYMNPDEIRNPDLTPNLGNIKALTDAIMTQINLDASGMDAYCYIIDHISDYFFSNFCQYFLCPSRALIPASEARQRLDRINNFLREAEQTYDHNWDSLIQQKEAAPVNP